MRGIALAGGVAYVAAGPSGLRLVDVHLPGSPVLLGSLDTPGDAQGIAIEDGRAYVADGTRGLQIIEVTDLRHPVLAATFDTPGSARGVSVAGGVAYVADDFMGLEILDVRNATPHLLGKYDTPGRAVGVAVGGGYAYVADLNRGLQILDVRHPEAPILVENFSTPGAAAAVAYSDDRLFVADGFAGLLEIDVGDPSHPVLTGAYDTPGVASGVAVASGLVYIADGSHGLRIIRPNPAIAEPETASGSTLGITLPAGFAPGPYDVQVTGPDGVTVLLPNGILVCPRHALTARLVPFGPAGAPATVPGGGAVVYRLRLDGDVDLFSPGSERGARLLLPALPSRVEVRTIPGAPWIDLRLGPAPAEATVIVSGPDIQESALLWEGIRAAGGIPLGALDARTYGDLRLALLPGAGPPSGRETWNAGPGLRYRYALEAGRLVEARAWGPGADLVFEISAVDADGCEAGTEVTYDAR